MCLSPSTLNQRQKHTSPSPRFVSYTPALCAQSGQPGASVARAPAWFQTEPRTAEGSQLTPEVTLERLERPAVKLYLDGECGGGGSGRNDSALPLCRALSAPEAAVPQASVPTAQATGCPHRSPPDGAASLL